MEGLRISYPILIDPLPLSILRHTVPGQKQPSLRKRHLIVNRFATRPISLAEIEAFIVLLGRLETCRAQIYAKVFAQRLGLYVAVVVSNEVFDRSNDS